MGSNSLKNGGMAEELGSALQKRVRGCESLCHLQIPNDPNSKKQASNENQ